MDRIAVFIDYENVHRTGHYSYADVGAPLFSTVVDPFAIAVRLVEARALGGELDAVHVFRGRPVPEHQPIPASANDAQSAAWEAHRGVVVHRRDLKYEFLDDGSFEAREKGIDVALAIALVDGALAKAFDVAIVFSADSDLLPALELVFQRKLAHLEIASWSARRPLWFADFLRESPPRRLPYCHFLDADDFFQCRDRTWRRD